MIGLCLTKMFDATSHQGILLSSCARELATAIERMQLAAAVRRSQLEVETEHMRSSLLSAVSHDLKTPLAAIVGASSTLLTHRDDISSQATGELLSPIGGEGERLARLVQNLLSMSRLESPTIDLHRTPEDVEDMVAASLDGVRSAIGTRSLTVSIPADLPPVMAEPALIGQVITNLIENILRYTPLDAAIEIAAKAEEGVIRIEVADSGQGIPEHERDKVFEKFYRGSRSSKSDGGVGLGLTICRAIVRAHGGRIAVRERPGGGTLVEFTLPLAPASLSWANPPEEALT